MGEGGSLKFGAGGDLKQASENGSCPRPSVTIGQIVTNGRCSSAL